ncbi:mavicyanin [Manihot esculenta]|uniref:Phytocyanin domain-containing protein n=2 Tax=Manihot esculenta TaxID=3983 RepID=A0A2C9W0C8_MANES|nr:mavicyanin [Manihot esculenta]XP_021609853.1 mavicyanin [Manihot esculenta]KAG8655788.1 hypothetical protein MANES_04G068400v8 [Manihot esculenta]OAY52246.1 hypothetical protein MANES_04G068400v8 [Manihot esculenta]
MASAVKTVVALAVISVSLCGKWVAAEVNHLVGGDHGWDPSTDVASWSSGRTFRIGDKIWFAYSMAQGTIAELKTKEEYDSCDISNPIRMYTNGLDSISLHEEGIRYFVSTNSKICKKGLKLHVEVTSEKSGTCDDIPKSEDSALAVAAGPTASDSTHVGASGVMFMLLSGIWLSYYYSIMGI